MAWVDRLVPALVYCLQHHTAWVDRLVPALVYCLQHRMAWVDRLVSALAGVLSTASDGLGFTGVVDGGGISCARQGHVYITLINRHLCLRGGCLYCWGSHVHITLLMSRCLHCRGHLCISTGSEVGLLHVGIHLGICCCRVNR